MAQITAAKPPERKLLTGESQKHILSKEKGEWVTEIRLVPNDVTRFLASCSRSRKSGRRHWTAKRTHSSTSSIRELKLPV